VNRTIIAEPVDLIREGLAAILSREKDIEVVSVLKRGRDVIPAARIWRPHVALLAAAFPDYEGIPLARALQAAAPGCHCAILCISRNIRYAQRVVAADLDGFLSVDCPAGFLTMMVRQLASGNKIIDPNLTFDALDYGQSPLTTRETEVLRAAAQGSTTAEIATHMRLAEGTVRNYLSRAIAKTSARNRVDAIRIADENGWL
jgi:two-component system, NarL family, response regulator DesR